MKTTAIYFSPTGNTKKYTETMAAAVTADYEVLDLTKVQNKEVQRTFGADELVIIGMPVYAGRIPMAAAPRLDGLKGNGTPCILVATYGNRHYDDALVEMEDIAKENGFVVKGAAALIGRHTYGAIEVNRPDAADLEAAADFAKRICAALDKNAEQKCTCTDTAREIEGKCASTPFVKGDTQNTTDTETGNGAETCIESSIPGSRPYQKEAIPGGQFKPLTSDACVGCGVCKEACPVAAIDDDFQVNPEICISCFRCIRNCPVGAKNMDVEAYLTFAEDFTKKLAARRENEFFM